MTKLRVGILFGGRSAEHEISLLSAKNIIAALDPEKYDAVLIKIEKDGRWSLVNTTSLLFDGESKNTSQVSEASESVSLLPASSGKLTSLTGETRATIDVFFPIVHGTLGEDGTLQGLLRLIDIPFVGADVLGSAIGMDKDVAKRLLRDAGIPIARFVCFTKKQQPTFQEVTEKLGLPLFVKPANMGSSVGVSKVTDEAGYLDAVDTAFRYDTKILIEEAIVGREIECAVLGNDQPKASMPGEIRTSHQFYSYDAKYLDEKDLRLDIPASLTPDEMQRIQSLAIKTFQILECTGLARVDFFLKSDRTAVVNEINTLPGFTNTSMYPKLWEASGIGYRELIDQLLMLAIERHKVRQRLETTRLSA